MPRTLVGRTVKVKQKKGRGRKKGTRNDCVPYSKLVGAVREVSETDAYVYYAERHRALWLPGTDLPIVDRATGEIIHTDLFATEQLDQPLPSTHLNPGATPFEPDACNPESTSVTTSVADTPLAAGPFTEENTATTSLIEATTSLIESITSLVEATTSRIEAPSSLIDTHTSLIEATASLVEATRFLIVDTGTTGVGSTSATKLVADTALLDGHKRLRQLQRCCHAKIGAYGKDNPSTYH